MRTNRRLIGVTTTVIAVVTFPATFVSPVAAWAGKLQFDVSHTQVGIFPIDSSAADPFLPPGFEPIPFQDSSPNGPTGLPAPPGADATVQVFGTTFTWAANPAGPSVLETMVIVWLYADPPDQYESGDVGPWPGVAPYPYMVVPNVVVTSSALAAELVDRGLPAQVAVISNTIQSVGASRLGEIEVDDGDAVWRLLTTVPDSAEPPVGPERLRFFGASNGVLTGVVDFDEGPHAHSPLGTATFLLDSGMPGFPTTGVEGVGIQTEPGYTMTLESIPEPATALLFAIGLALLPGRTSRW